MEQPQQKLTSPTSLVVDAILLIAFFLFMGKVIAAHVPSRDPRMITLWGALGSSCLTAVFWLAIQMFRAVLRGQLEAGRKQPD